MSLFFKRYLGRGKFYHVINSPDEQEIEFQQRGFYLANHIVRTLPNYPNYRLYDMSNSSCDTLGINAPMVGSTNSNHFNEETLQLYPNPTGGIIQWNRFPSQEPLIIRVHDTLGRLCMEQQKSYGSADLSGLLDGIYFVTLMRENGHQIVSKSLVLSKL